MPRRIVVHAGLHKTGTTSVQQHLKLHRDLVGPDLRIVLHGAMDALKAAARGYSVTRNPVDLALLRYEAAQLARHWVGKDDVVLLSSEDLSGHMPGRHGLAHIRARLPAADVVDLRIEDHADHPLGVCDAMLGLAGVTQDRRARMAALPHANAAPAQAIRDALLTLNRSDLTDDALKEAKFALTKQVA